MAPPPVKRCRGEGCQIHNPKPAEDNCIRFSVHDPSQVTYGGLRSPEKMIAGFPWTISACYRTDSDTGKCFGVFLRCEMSKLSAIWYCQTTFELRIVNQIDPSRAVKREMSYRFSSSSSGGYGTPNWVEFAKVIDPEEGYCKDDIIIVEARITVESDHGSRFRRRTEIEFGNPSDLSDIVLIVEGKQMHVSRQFLAAQSSYFRSLFYRGFKESNEPAIHMGEDVKFEEFTALLKVLYRTAHLVADTNVVPILALADRFDFKMIIDEIELFLMRSDKMGPDRKLRIADEFRLATVKDAALDYFDCLSKIDKLLDSPEFPSLSKELTDVIFKKYVRLRKVEELKAK